MALQRMFYFARLVTQMQPKPEAVRFHPDDVRTLLIGLDFPPYVTGDEAILKLWDVYNREVSDGRRNHDITSIVGARRVYQNAALEKLEDGGGLWVCGVRVIADGRVGVGMPVPVVELTALKLTETTEEHEEDAVKAHQVTYLAQVLYRALAGRHPADTLPDYVYTRLFEPFLVPNNAGRYDLTAEGHTFLNQWEDMLKDAHQHTGDWAMADHLQLLNKFVRGQVIIALDPEVKEVLLARELLALTVKPNGDLDEDGLPVLTTSAINMLGNLYLRQYPTSAQTAIRTLPATPPPTVTGSTSDAAEREAE